MLLGTISGCAGTRPVQTINIIVQHTESDIDLKSEIQYGLAW